MNRKPEQHEPIFGDGWRQTILAILYRPSKFLFVDVPCMAAAWVALAFILAYRHDNVWAVAHLGLACLYWAARKYFDPVIRAICAWIEGKGKGATP